MRGEGEEEGSDTFKALKTKGLPYPYPLPFFPLSIVFLVKKRGIGRAFYIWGGVREGEGKEEDC